MIVDAHHHFLEPVTFTYPWIDENSPIARDYAPPDLEPLLQDSGIDRTVLVQAYDDRAETIWMLEIASSTPWIAGVVGFIDLMRGDVRRQLAEYHEAPGGEHLVGVRHALDDVPALPLLSRPDVVAGLAHLEAERIPVDLLLRHPALSCATEIARSYPDLPLVINHLAKPVIKAGWAAAREWTDDLATLAHEPNVSCKLSGLVTEADWETWSVADLEPFVTHAFECFGAVRMLFGTDWPVCELAASYPEVVDVARSLTAACSNHERSAIFGGNATTFYGLEQADRRPA